jgi:hypothetical protein
MDKTNKYAWGKVMVNIKKISNFPYNGSIFVRISLPPWQIASRRLQAK